MRIAAWFMGFVIVTLVAVGLLGWVLNPETVTHGEMSIRGEPQAVWDVVTDFAEYPAWRPEVTAVVAQSGGGRGWVESQGKDSLEVEILSEDPPHTWVLRAATRDFEVTWTYRLDAAASGTRVSLKEERRIQNPMLVALSRWFTDPAVRVDQQLTRLRDRVEGT